MLGDRWEMLTGMLTVACGSESLSRVVLIMNPFFPSTKAAGMVTSLSVVSSAMEMKSWSF